MNLIFVTLLATKLLLSSSYPTDGLVEIEKQRLIKFPEESLRIEDNEQKTSEAKRILEEINKINVALGYVKKQDQSLPSLLDSNQFLFPKPAYNPFHSQSINEGNLQPSIRNFNQFRNPYSSLSSKSIKSSDSKLYFYNYQQPDDKIFIEKPSLNQFQLSTNANNLREFKLVDYKVMSDYEEPYENKPAKLLEPKLRLYFVPRQLNVNEKSMDYQKNEKLIKIEKIPTVRPLSKVSGEKPRPTSKQTISGVQKYSGSTSTTTTTSPPISSLKTPFGFFNRPGHRVTAQKIEVKPVLQSVPLELPQYTQQQVRPDAVTIDNWDSDSSEESDYPQPQDYEKHFFVTKRKPDMAEVQKEALKESGIIIQRLKVRKGGIAIAGPGGVATAGSGGTAIVGPGGYALTHPRSLTIAGPGAKIIAVPESTDLKDALQRTSSGRSFTEEGELVATGPVVYYSPDDNSEIL